MGIEGLSERRRKRRRRGRMHAFIPEQDDTGARPFLTSLVSCSFLQGSHDISSVGIGCRPTKHSGLPQHICMHPRMFWVRQYRYTSRFLVRILTLTSLNSIYFRARIALLILEWDTDPQSADVTAETFRI